LPSSSLPRTPTRRYFVFKTQPNVAVMVVHEAHGPYVDDISNIAPHTFLITLSPHVSVMLSRRYGKPTWWALPSWEVNCNHTCSDQHECFHKGFVVQVRGGWGVGGLLGCWCVRCCVVQVRPSSWAVCLCTFC
jgi:hypothetical protein